MSEWTDYPHKDIGARLRSVREAFTQDGVRAFARRMNVPVMSISGWETGARRISIDAAERYCDMFGVTLDWIYRGRRDGLAETASKVL